MLRSLNRLPLRERYLVAIRHLLEVPASLLVKAVGLLLGHILALLLLSLDRFLLRGQLAVDADVQLEQVVDGVLLQRFLVPVPLEGESKEAVLLSPIAQVVDPPHIPAAPW